MAGWPPGPQKFSTRAEAETERQVLEIQRLQADSGLRLILTCLNEDQVQEAEAAFRKLKGTSRSLLFYLDYALANYREPACDRPLADAVADYLASMRLENQRTLLSPRQLRSIENELGVFLRHFPKGAVSQFTPARLTQYLERGKGGLKTYNNRRGLISTFFKYAFQKDWIVTNPVENTPHHRINLRRGSAVTLSAAQSRDLMAYLETFEKGSLVPHAPPLTFTFGKFAFRRLPSLPATHSRASFVSCQQLPFSAPALTRAARLGWKKFSTSSA